MHERHLTRIEDPGPARIPAGLIVGFLLMGVVGMVGFVIGLFTSGTDTSQVWMGLVVSYLFFFFLAMGAGAFLAINYVTGAKWFIAIKRPLEAIASFAYKGGFVFPLLALGGTYALYSWAAPDRYYPYEGTLKALYLSPSIHVVKVAVYVALLTLIAFVLVRRSTEADTTKPKDFQAVQHRNGIIFLLIFAPIFSLLCVDVIMSLEPKWFSTMFGVYCFTGALMSAVALAMMMSFWLRSQTAHVRERQIYDMGTYVMAFATFMVYIGFSQFMLIWYANIPDETAFFIKRYEGGWLWLTIALPVLKWVIPFFLLMPPTLRTNVIAQTICCTSILLGQLLDLYWMVAPALPQGAEGAYGPTFVNILTFLGVFGFFGWSVLTFLARYSILPTGDPDLLNSVNGEYLHA